MESDYVCFEDVGEDKNVEQDVSTNEDIPTSSSHVPVDTFFNEFCISRLESGCILPAAHQGYNTFDCYAYPVIRTMYADQWLHKSKNLEEEAHEGSVKELVEMLNKETYISETSEKPNSFHNAFTYIKNYGLHLADEYPNMDQSSTDRRIFIKDFKMIEDHGEILHQLNEQPLCGAIVLTPSYASLNYDDKIYAPSDEEMQEIIGKAVSTPYHAILMIGHGQEGGVEHFVCQNSLGTEWGHNGFFKVRVGAVGFITYPICTHMKTIEQQEYINPKDCGFTMYGGGRDEDTEIDTESDPMIIDTESDPMEIDME